MNKLPVILDIETFRYDLLMGIKDMATGKYHFYWNSDIKPALDKIIKEDRYVITYNGEHYDLPLLYNYFYNSRNQASFFELSKFIVEDNLQLSYPKTFVKSIDLMASLSSFQSLKLVEAILGWEIRETSISFDYEFKLTNDQRKEIEHYNIQDLDTSEALYNKMQNYFNLRVNLAEYLGIEHDYRIPLPTLMGLGLGAHRQVHEPVKIDPRLEEVPIISDVKQVLLDHMKGRRPGLSYTFEIKGVSYTVGDGGIHSNIDPIDRDDVYHVDVKGYYTLIQLLFNLFSRNIPIEGIEKVVHMYFERLKLSGSNFDNMSKILYDKILEDYPRVHDYIFNETVELNYTTANSLKIGILSIWGAMRNFHHILYDFDVGFLVTLYGQFYIIYLIQLLAYNGIEIVNANTDGLIVTGDIETITEHVNYWQNYTGFDVEVNKYKRFVAKDVNNYIMGNSLDKLTTKGRDFTGLRDWMFSNVIVIPQTPVMAKILSEILFKKIDKDKIRSYVESRIKDFEPMDYMFIANHTLKFSGMFFLETGELLQRTNRVYAHVNGGTVYKFKGDFIKHDLIYVEEKIHYLASKDGKDVTRYKTVKGYIKESRVTEFNDKVKELKEMAFMNDVKDLEKLLDNPSITSDGKTILHMYGDNQYKYPGLPLVKTFNDDISTANIKDMNIDYEYYINEIIKKYNAYYE